MFYTVLLISLFSLSAFADESTCPNVSNDEKKIVIMYDTNFILEEVEAARKGACANGLAFKVLPYGYEQHKRIGLLREKTYRKRSYYTNSSTNRSVKQAEYEAARKTEKEEIKKLVDEVGAVKPFSDFRELSKGDFKIQSLVLSGHDGGGSIYGSGGRLNKHDIILKLKAAFFFNEEGIEDLKHLYLWGCYTATESEVSSWLSGLPQLDTISGFHGSGPSIGKKASSGSLEYLVTNQSKFYEIATAEKMKEAFESVDYIKYLLAGLYAKSCNESGYYFSHESNKVTKGIRKTFKTFDHDCSSEDFAKVYEESNKEFLKYYSGEKDIPKKTGAGTPLREIYNFSRQNRECIDELFPNSLMDPNRVALLLFFKGVKENFFHLNKDLILDVKKELDSLPVTKEDVLNHENSLFGYNLVDSGILKAVDLIKGKEHLSKYLDENQKMKAKMPDIPNELNTFKELSKKDLHNLATYLDGILHRSLLIETTDEVDRRNDKFIKLRNALNIYTHDLNPKCMDWVDWHEHSAYDGNDASMGWFGECSINEWF